MESKYLIFITFILGLLSILTEALKYKGFAVDAFVLNRSHIFFDYSAREIVERRKT